MEKDKNTTISVSKKSVQWIRIIAARRGLRPGVLINQVLDNKAAFRAALSVLDEQALEREVRNDLHKE